MYGKFDLDGNIIQYELWEIPKGGIFLNDVHYCLYNCPSTGKEYMSGVPNFERVDEAMAWKSSMDVKDWRLLVPLVDES